MCETYGRDLLTGAASSETEYRALNPDGKAILKAADTCRRTSRRRRAPAPRSTPAARSTTSTRARRPGARRSSQAAAPDVWVELSAADAAARGLAEGDLAEVTSPRGQLRARVRITGDPRPGVVFVPFHYGYWDRRRRHDRAPPTS